MEPAAVIYGSDERVQPGRQVVHCSRLGFEETVERIVNLALARAGAGAALSG